MESSKFQALILIAAVVGSSILGVGSHNIGSSVGDMAILLVLFAFDYADRSGFQSVGFAGVSGFCLLTPLFFLANNVLGAAVPTDSTPWMFAGIWAILTLLMFGLDRFRAGSKDNVSLAGISGGNPAPITASPVAPGYRPAPIRVEPVYSQSEQVAEPAYTAPPVAGMVQSVSSELQATNIVSPASSAQAVEAAPQPDVTAIPPGREAIIYLNLVGEGLNVLRTVRAENLGRDYYRIADVMPENEQWEFTPGQVVKCRKKALSNGKHMVAYEEAPRAQ